MPSSMNGRFPSLHHKLLQVNWKRCVCRGERLGGNHPSTAELITLSHRGAYFADYNPPAFKKKKEERKANESEGTSNVMQEAQYG
jgi:hypothetical protein